MKIKRIVAAVTALVLVGGAYNATAAKNVISNVFAADTEASAEVVKDGIKYTISNGNAIVTGLSDDTITDLVIPDEVDGCPVTEIGSKAFMEDDYDWEQRYGLKSITLGKNVEKVGAYAFVDCREIETITLNDGLKYIDEYAFAGCCAVSEIKLGSKLETIGKYAFRCCFALENIDFGENVSEIGLGAFERTSIDFLEVPEKVTELNRVFEEYPVANCGVVIKNPECSLVMKDDWGDDIVIVCDKNSLARRDAQKYGIKCIDFEQYKNGEYEKKEQSPYSSLSVAGKYGMTFEEVERGLKVRAINFIKGGTLIVPDEVAGMPVVEFGPFDSEDTIRVNSEVYYSTKKIVLGKNVKKLGERAFANFSNLEYIEGGEGLEEIGKGAFDDMRSLGGIAFRDNIKNMKFCVTDRRTSYLAYGMVFAEVEGGITVSYASPEEDVLVIPDEVCGIPVVGIGDITNAYGEYSSKCVVDERVYQGKLKKLVIGKNVKIIGEDAFENCSALEIIEGGENLEEIGKNAFDRCENIKSISFLDNMKNIKYDVSDNYISNLLYGMVLENVNGEILIKDINENAVKDGTLVIPDEVCGLPVSYMNEAGSKKLANSSVSDGFKVDVYTYPAYRLNFIDDEIKEKIKKVVIGKNLKVIPTETFIDCKNLESIEGGEGVLYIGSDAFKNCTSLTAMKLPESVIELNDSVFSGCTALEEAELNNGLQDMGDSTFKDCSNLKKVKFGNSLKKIGIRAFENTDLNAIDIPENVKDIDIDAFTWKDKTSEDKAVVKIYSADCDFYSNSIKLDKVGKIYGYAGSTAERIAKINQKDFYAFGDANSDGGVDMADVVLVMQSLANPNKYGLNGTDEHHITEKGIDCADVEGNSNGITASDALKIQKYLLGQEKFL